jgi:equilibrative nucleoside transporter 1/2/3
MSFVEAVISAADVGVGTSSPDVSRSLWLAVACVGAECLLAYNAILSTQPYYSDDDHGVFKGLYFEFTCMICYSGPLCLTQAYMTWKPGDISAFDGRMRFGFAGILVANVLLLVVTATAQTSKLIMYFLCLLTICILSVTSAVMQAGLMAFCASLSPKASAAAMFGLGLAGLLTFGFDEVFRVFGCGLLLQTELLYILCILWTVLSFWICHRFILSQNWAPPQVRDIDVAETPNTVGQQLRTPDDSPDAKSVLRAIFPQAMNVFLVFSVSLTLFPGVVVHWKLGEGASTAAQAGFTTFVIGLFQVFDVVGRYGAGPVAKFIRPGYLVWLVLARFAFIPLFILGQRQTENAFWLSGSSAGRSLLMALFAFSNGFVGSCAMMYGPEAAPRAGRELAGTAMSCSMVWGIFSGCLLALLTQLGVSHP